MVLSSGGVDSTTALGLAIKKHGRENVIALSLSYGQKHEKEIEAAKKVAAHYGIEQLFLDLSKIFQYSNCSLLKQSDEEIPEESYAEQIKETKGAMALPNPFSSTTSRADEWQTVPSFKVLVSNFPRGDIYRTGKRSWLNKEPTPSLPRREGERQLEICWRGAGVPASILDSPLP